MRQPTRQRLLVHFVNLSGHADTASFAPIETRDISVELAHPLRSATAMRLNQKLSITTLGQQRRFVLPRLDAYEVVERACWTSDDPLLVGRMQPFEGVSGAEAVALAEPGKVYVVYLPHGGRTTVDLTVAKGTLSGYWFNPRDSMAGEQFEVAADSNGEFQTPTTTDWVIVLRSGSLR